MTPFDQYLKKKQLKRFIMKQTSLPESIKFVRAEQGGGRFCGGGDNAAMDWQPTQRGVETPLVAS